MVVSLISEFKPTIAALVELEHRNTTQGLSFADRDEWVRLTRRLFGFDQHERRRFFRLHTRLNVDVAFEGGTTRAEVFQISAGGAGLIGDALATVAIGDRLDVRFGAGSLLAGHAVSAVVVWADDIDGGIGIQFVDISPSVRSAVIEFLGGHLDGLLTRAEDAFKLFFHHSLDLAALLEVDGRIITISETGAVAFGAASPGELVGRSFASLVEPRDTSSFTAACERAQLGGRTRMRLALIDATGTPIAADLAITPFRIEDLRLGCFLAGHDDRDRKAAEDEVQRLERRLIVTDTMATLGYISAGIAHDVNNPLTFILMLAESLQEMGERLGSAVDQAVEHAALLELASEIPEIAGDIFTGAQRIADLITELSRFTTLATGDAQASDLSGVIMSVTVMVRNLINHRARFEQSHDPTITSVGLSSGRLTQILLNLLSNAAQAFTDSNVDRNLIRLVTSRQRDHILIEVIDNGPGIPEARRVELLQAFATTRAEVGGTGLGLAIAKDCAESVGGSLSILESEGGGTHIKVLLPAHESMVSPRKRVTRISGIQLDGAPRVLILDDELSVLNAYERALKSQFEVVTTTSPTEALALTGRQDYDVIVCDVMIPGISGLDFHDRLAAGSPELARRIIFVTGGTMSGAERSRLRDLGNNIILKPVSARALADAVWQLVAELYEPVAPP